MAKSVEDQRRDAAEAEVDSWIKQI